MTKQFYTVLVSVFLTTIIISHLLKSSKLALPFMFFTYKSYYLITTYNFVLYAATRFLINLNFPDGYNSSDRRNKGVDLSTFVISINSINPEIGKPVKKDVLNKIPVSEKGLLN